MAVWQTGEVAWIGETREELEFHRTGLESECGQILAI